MHKILLHIVVYMNYSGVRLIFMSYFGTSVAMGSLVNYFHLSVDKGHIVEMMVIVSFVPNCCPMQLR